MSEKRRALGRGLGALIPNSPAGDGAARPVDVFFKDNSAGQQARSGGNGSASPAGTSVIGSAATDHSASPAQPTDEQATTTPDAGADAPETPAAPDTVSAPAQ